MKKTFSKEFIFKKYDFRVLYLCFNTFMMNIAIYSAFYSTTSITYIKSVIDYLEENKHDFILVDRLKKHLGSEASKYNYYKMTNL